MKEKIKNLLVDFGGVLIDLDRERCIRQFQALGMNTQEVALHSFQQEGVFSLHEQGKISSDEFRARLRRWGNRPVTDEELDAAWNSFLVSVPDYKLELLLRLRTRYRVFLLSNTNEIHWEWALKHVFGKGSHTADDYFEHCFLSFRMGLAKPDSAIFQEALREGGLKPEETFFIDDSAANCEAAQALGIETYTPRAQEDWSHLFQDL